LANAKTKKNSDLCEEIDGENIAKNLVNIAHCYTELDNHEKALEIHQEQLKSMQEMSKNGWHSHIFLRARGSLSSREYDVLNSIGRSHYSLNQIDLALCSFKQCLTISQVYFLFFCRVFSHSYLSATIHVNLKKHSYRK